MSAAERWVLERLAGGLRCGSLVVRYADGSACTFVGARPGPAAEVDLHDERLIRRLVTTGAIGLADGWIAGEFDSPDLASVIELGALHLEPRDRPRVPAVLERAGRAAWKAIGPASVPRGPLRTTVEHYDLGNGFFRAWLDRSMTYSSAVFAREDMSLEEAQQEKYRRISAAAGLRAGMHVLEIGAGWGGFATHAAGDLGCVVTTVTDSREQATWVEKLLADRGLGDRVEVRLEDFSRTPGTYDAIVSIEMIESIPRARWPEFFRVLAARLAADGRIGVQAITVGDRHWDSSNANPDFIRRYVFPGGQVPSPGVVRADASAADLRLVARSGYGVSYARTLAEWRRRFDAAWPQLVDLGFDDRFKRMWQYYLSYCEGGFRSGRVDVSQIVLQHRAV
ncbi:MAG: class I SAM-dependent methyltransferase [Solirubrobacterales bacterium]